MLAILVLLQSLPLADAAGFDLRNYQSPRPGCGSSTSRDIVVCGRTTDRGNRVQAGELPPDPILPRAEFDVGGGAKISVDGEGAGVGGFVSNRVMLRLKVPF
jgi:hypothetical protein